MRMTGVVSGKCKWLAFLLIAGFIGSPHLVAQKLSQTSQTLQAEASAYRILFRRDCDYVRLADQAEAAGKSKPHLRYVLSVRFRLETEDSANLDRLSMAYKSEADVIQARIKRETRAFGARFLNRCLDNIVDHSPPPELALLQQQADALVLRYRDLLRNNMADADFQNLDKQVLATFNQRLQPLTEANTNVLGTKPNDYIMAVSFRGCSTVV